MLCAQGGPQPGREMGHTCWPWGEAAGTSAAGKSWWGIQLASAACSSTDPLHCPPLLPPLQLVEDVLRRGVPGSIAECGVWRGGASLFAKAVLAAHGAQREVHLVDSFQGLPPNTTAQDQQARALQGGAGQGAQAAAGGAWSCREPAHLTGCPLRSLPPAPPAAVVVGHGAAPVLFLRCGSA